VRSSTRSVKSNRNWELRLLYKPYAETAILLFAFVACRASSTSDSAAQRAVETVTANTARSSQAAPEGAGASAAAALPSSAGSVQVPPTVEPERVFSDVAPLCGFASDVPGAKGAAGARPKTDWLNTPVAQERLHRVHAALEGLRPAPIGVTFDDSRRTVVVVLPGAFATYVGLAANLSRVAAPLRVALRHSCHSPAEIARAQTLLEKRNWHPQASSTPTAWYLDPSFAGFRVTIDDSAPEVRAALEQKLGTLVRAELGKPRRL